MVVLYISAGFFTLGALVSFFEWDLLVALQAIIVALLLVLGARFVMRKRAEAHDVEEEDL